MATRKTRNPAVALRLLGAAVRRRREAAGLSQEAAAHGAGISVRHYQKIEGGTTNPAYLTLLAVAAALHAAPEDLVAAAR